MKTLIELYDERPLENVLSTEVFSPERTVFICPPEVGRDARLQQKLREYFAHRGVRAELEFVIASLLDASAVANHLREVVARHPDCALDIAGGTDAALFAAGLLCANVDIPVFTYSRKRNTFFDIHGAAFARDLPCQVRLKVEDCFLMAGGAMRTGRVDNAVLARYAGLIPQLYHIYMKYRRQWNGIVTYIQRISQGQEGHPTLLAQGAYQVKAPQGGRVQANPDAHPLFHSDRGFQYTNRTFHHKLVQAGMTQSMSRVAHCIDNGPMEGFWGILKRERYYGRQFTSKRELVQMIENYIRYYNTRRVQRNLGVLTPMEKHTLCLAA